MASPVSVVLTSRNKEGTGVHVILAGSIHGTITEVGYKSELFDRDEEHAIKYATDWVKEFGPRLVETSVGQTIVDTKLSQLFGIPPDRRCRYDALHCSLGLCLRPP